MKKLFTVALLLSAAAAAMAGYKAAAAVSVYPASRYAAGQLGTARNSTDTMQYIGCSYEATSTYHYVSCNARNSAGTYGGCVGYDASMIDAAHSLPSDGYLFFAWDANGTCIEIQASNYSYHEPKQP